MSQRCFKTEKNRNVNCFTSLFLLYSISKGFPKKNKTQLSFYINFSKITYLQNEKRKLIVHTKDVVREIAIMKKLDHKNVVKLYEIINDSEHEKIYMGNFTFILTSYLPLLTFKTVMEYISGGPILKLSDKSPSEPLPLDIVRSYFRDIICGVEYCKEFSFSQFSKVLTTNFKISAQTKNYSQRHKT